MAKATTKKTATAAKAKAERPNLFAKSKSKTADKPAKKAKGTVFALPKDLDTEGSLQGASKALNEAITDVIVAKQRQGDPGVARVEYDKQRMAYQAGIPESVPAYVDAGNDA